MSKSKKPEQPAHENKGFLELAGEALSVLGHNIVEGKDKVVEVASEKVTVLKETVGNIIHKKKPNKPAKKKAIVKKPAKKATPKKAVKAKQSKKGGKKATPSAKGLKAASPASKTAKKNAQKTGKAKKQRL